MELYLKLIDVIVPVFFVIGVGYYLGKKNPEISTDFITTFAGNVGTPAMIFYTITTTGVTLSVFTEYFIYALIIIGGFSLVGILFLLLLKKDFISELPPLILPNTGNMGIPICLFAYGTAGLGVASAIASVIILLHFTLGVLLAKKSFSFKILIKNMPIYGIIVSIIFLYFEGVRGAQSTELREIYRLQWSNPPKNIKQIIAAKMLVAGPAANIRILSLLGALVNSSYCGSAKAPSGKGPNCNSPNDRIRIP